MKVLLIAVAVLVVLSVVGFAYVRLAPHDPARWHVDPATVTEVRTRDQFKATATFDLSFRSVASILRARMDREPRTQVLAGSAEQGLVTYVIRTPTIGYPDYVSFGIDGEGGITRLTILSRSRFAYSDMGANRARVEAILSDMVAEATRSSL